MLMRMVWCVGSQAMMLADRGDTVLPANPLQRGLVAPLQAVQEMAKS